MFHKFTASNFKFLSTPKKPICLSNQFPRSFQFLRSKQPLICFFFWICLLWAFHIDGTIRLMIFVASFYHIAYIFKLSDHYCTKCQSLVILNAARYPIVWTGHTILMNSVVSRHFSCSHFFFSCGKQCGKHVNKFLCGHAFSGYCLGINCCAMWPTHV